MAKSKEQLFIEAIKRKQNPASEKARKAFEKTGELEIVIDQIKKSKTAAVLQEPWVLNALQQIIREDRKDILKKAFLPRRGERSKPRLQALEKLLFAHEIDKHREAGQTLSVALLTELQRTGGGSLTGKSLEKKLTALKNRYQAAKRVKTEIAVTETADTIILTAFPAKWSFDLVNDGEAAAKTFTGFGTWKLTFPKK